MLKSSLTAIVLMAVSSSLIAAQVEVIDSEPVTPTGAVSVYQNSPPPPPRVTTTVAAEGNFSQMQAMQEEIQQLRGLVEQQSNEIKRLKQQREDDYADIDRRLSALSKGGSSAADEATTGTKKPVNAEKKSPQLNALEEPSSPPKRPNQKVSPSDLSDTEIADTGADTASGRSDTALSDATKTDTADPAEENSVSGEDEFTAYSSALNLIVKTKDYERGVVAMNKYLAQFPKGKYAPNAHFWVGSAYQSQNKPELAIQSYEKMIKRYPREPKSDDARLKLARVYLQRGDKEEARLLLDEILEGGGQQSKAAQDMLSKHF
jgi:tol-pal system protein YbgF